VKLAITVDSEIHAKLLDAARAECTNVPGWLTEAARRALLLRDGIAAARVGSRARCPRSSGARTGAHTLGPPANRAKTSGAMKKVVYDSGVLVAADRTK
jgi:hypothetical protein